jgi:hypothetical protein
MIKIAHRGNIFGPNPEMENSPYYLLEAVEAGFDVEVDIWVNENGIAFGHDEPEYLFIPEMFLLEIGHAAWFHCKNLEALHLLNTTFPQLNYFWHQEDDYTLTSQGFIWAYPGKETTGKTVLVDLDGKSGNINAYAICSDNVGEL